jgi:hypothetical protein
MLRLPVAMAQHLDVFLHLEKPLLRRRQSALARQKISRQGLQVRIAQKSPGDKFLRVYLSRR